MAGPFYIDSAVGDDGNAGTSEGVGNAWQTIQKGADTVASGEICHIKASSNYVITAQIDFDTQAGTFNSPIKFFGYTTTPGDGGIIKITTSATPVDMIDIATAQEYVELHNIEIDATGCTSTGIDSNADQSFLDNIKVYNVLSGWAISLAGADTSVMQHCEIHTGYGGAYTDSYVKVLYNYIHDTDHYGIQTPANSGVVIGNIIANNAWGGLYMSGTQSLERVSNNIIDGNARGIQIGRANTIGNYIVNNIISNCTTGLAQGLYFESSYVFGTYVLDYNAWYNNTTDITEDAGVPRAIKGANTITLTESPYTTPGSDYTLNNTAGGGADCKQIAIPAGILTESTNISYQDTGLQAEASASASSTTIGLIG